jgi:hydrogenase-4 membrane subunit HyfE
MELGIPHIVFVLTVAIIALSVMAMLDASLERASYCMVGVAFAMTSVYVVYGIAVDNQYLFGWAAIYAVTRIWLLPFFKGGLLYTARRMPPPDLPKASIWGTMIFAAVALLVMLIFSVKYTFVLVVSPGPLTQLGEKVSLNLLLAVFLILYGIMVLLTHRHPFKMVLGILLMEAGIHLSLVHLVPKLLGMVQIGIFSNFVGSIFVVLYINRLIVSHLKVTDTVKLSDLNY